MKERIFMIWFGHGDEARYTYRGEYGSIPRIGDKVFHVCPFSKKVTFAGAISKVEEGNLDRYLYDCKQLNDLMLDFGKDTNCFVGNLTDKFVKWYESKGYDFSEVKDHIVEILSDESIKKAKNWLDADGHRPSIINNAEREG